MREITNHDVLEAIKPTNAGTGEETLVYKNLAATVQKFRPSHAARLAELRGSKKDSLEWLTAARSLAYERLMIIAEKVVNSSVKNRDLWSDRFTAASIEIYGQPDPEEVAQLLINEYWLLKQSQIKDNSLRPYVKFLISVYGPIVDGRVSSLLDEKKTEAEKIAIREYGTAIMNSYRPLFDLVDKSARTEYGSKDLQRLFDRTLKWLEEHDDKKWSKWATISVNGTSLSVDAASRKIEIANHREPASAEDTRGLIAHELLVHALRAKNGYKTGNTKLATGLVGHIDTEEGLGILAEDAVNGRLPDRAYDRYVDIALALGSVDGVQRSRKEIFQISFARQLIRGRTGGVLNEPGVPSLERRVWGHVDRIYRGGKGDSLNARQAVFTKDIVYYVGYKQMSRYITRQLAAGEPVSKVFKYLSRAKFDPMNSLHIEELAKWFDKGL
ncbi:MAG: tyrosine/phenylalanine carboxypeptidase domain-containing protein [Candidatus Saccharimonadales bacterium]